MMKGVTFTIRGCYRSVWNHPFLVCVLCALIYMWRSHPFIFSLLVSASPVLVCTAGLLGTLLFYGQQNIPENEKDKKTAYEAVGLKNELPIDANVDECVEKYSEDKKDGVNKVAVESGLLVNKLGEIRVGRNVDGAAALSKERRSYGAESENGENSEADGESDHPIQQRKSEWNGEKVSDGDGEVMMDHYAIISKVIGELLESESEHEKSGGDSSDSEVQRHKDEGDDDSSDLGSDGAESSSPDASVDDMMPMLDELHPLLDVDAAHPVQMSRVGSEAVLTEQSSQSSISSNESGDETEVHDSEVADDEDDDDDEAQGDKEDQIKPVITWTEEDQKNLMDVGSSEIERNQRLERILRRRKNMSMVPEINLIDFENPDFQFHIPPISTGGRQNPFDLPDDSYDNSVPGSAPSVLSQRRNPFDMPDESSEGDQTERTEDFREEFRPSQTRHPFFRRRAVGPSIFSPNRQERRPVKLRPFFVSEQTVAEDSSGVSSVHEAESVSSVESLEEQDLEKADVHQDQDQVSKDVSNEQCQSSEDEEPVKFGSDSVAVAPDTSRQTSAEIADLSVATTLADDIPTREPVYDTSPSAVGNNYSSSSSFSDVHAEPDKRTQSEVPSSSSHLEHSVDHEETVGAANENLNSTQPAFYDRAKHWLGFGYQENVQVPNTPVESVKGVQDSVEVEAGILDSSEGEKSSVREA
ncbi:hypothetical protein C2S52_005097 [Perilla frutescens var. hirtella]|nr:hypothetical protein C2S52_005097 [Perilla frutescens var. hirtella]